MILKQEPMSLAEVKEMLPEEKEEIEKFIKSFTKIKPENARKLKEELTGLGILKIKPGDIAKIIDILPEDASDLNKILVDTSLSEDEVNKILEVIKRHK